MPYYRPSDVADKLGVTSRHIRRICEQLGLPHTRRDWIITAADIPAIRDKLKRKSKIVKDSA